MSGITSVGLNAVAFVNARSRTRAAILGLGWVLVLGTAIWILTLPMRLTV